MFKKILVVCAIGMIFSNSAIFAVEQEANQQIMLPITAGMITLQSSDFDSQGNAVVHINNFGPGSCPSPYVSPAAKYPWIMAYPSAYQVGHGISFPSIESDPSSLMSFFANAQPKPVFNLSVSPVCDATGCNIKVVFQYLTHYLATTASQDTCNLAPKGNRCTDPFGNLFTNGYLTVTYVAYCSTQPIANEPGKPQPIPTKQ